MKKIIKSYLRKKLSYAHPNHYLFLRWLASLVHDVEREQYVLRCIACYQDGHEGFRGVLRDLFVIDNDVYLYTSTPGAWIGRAGSTFNDVVRYMNYTLDGEKLTDYELHLIEEVDTSVLYYESYYRFLNR